VSVKQRQDYSCLWTCSRSSALTPEGRLLAPGLTLTHGHVLPDKSVNMYQHLNLRYSGYSSAPATDFHRFPFPAGITT